MKKTFILAAMAALMLATACGKKDAKDNNTIPTAAGNTAANASANGLRVAIVDMDTLINQYQLRKDQVTVSEKEQKNAQTTLESKQKALQKHVNSFQQKLQSNGFTSQEEFDKAQANLQREEAQLQELAARLEGGLIEQEQKNIAELNDSLQTFLQSYNATMKFDIILPRSGNSILLSNPALDITNDVVQGLNKRYTPSAEMTEKLKK